MDWRERVWGYTGGTGLIQAFATGYFTWDLYMCARYVNIFGVGMLAHGMSALCVYAFGYVSFDRRDIKPKSRANRLPAAFCELLRASLHPVRTLLALSQRPLVLR